MTNERLNMGVDSINQNNCSVINRLIWIIIMKAFLFLSTVIICVSCANSSNNKPVIWKLPASEGQNRIQTESNGSAYYGIKLTGVIEICNKCKGSGQIIYGLSSKPTICPFCWTSTQARIANGWKGFNGRFGQVDAAFNRLPSNYFQQPGNAAGTVINSRDNGYTREQLLSEIQYRQESIARIEQTLQIIEGTVNKSYLEQQLIEERYELQRLQRLLNNIGN